MSGYNFHEFQLEEQLGIEVLGNLRMCAFEDFKFEMLQFLSSAFYLLIRNSESTFSIFIPQFNLNFFEFLASHIFNLEEFT